MKSILRTNTGERIKKVVIALILTVLTVATYAGTVQIKDSIYGLKNSQLKYYVSFKDNECLYNPDIDVIKLNLTLKTKHGCTIFHGDTFGAGDDIVMAKCGSSNYFFANSKEACKAALVIYSYAVKSLSE